MVHAERCGSSAWSQPPAEVIGTEGPEPGVDAPVPAGARQVVPADRPRTAPASRGITAKRGIADGVRVRRGTKRESTRKVYQSEPQPIAILAVFYGRPGVRVQPELGLPQV